VNTERQVWAWRSRENLRPERTWRYLARGGPLDGGEIVLSVSGDGYTLPLRVGDEAGRYKRLGLGVPGRIPGSAVWEPSP
jgi:hypothetical protein